MEIKDKNLKFAVENQTEGDLKNYLFNDCPLWRKKASAYVKVLHSPYNKNLTRKE